MKQTATILLVEDDRALLEGIADLLEVTDIGYAVDVLTAADGVEGLALLENHHPDLVISDIMMPRMGGFQFLQHLRANPAWVHIPVIFLTARGTKKDVLEGRLSGAELYITKPYDSNELLQLVKSQLDRAFELEHSRQVKFSSLTRNIVKLMNHEIRTPLTYVSAYSEMLSDGLINEDADSVREYLRGIQSGAGRLGHLVDDLLWVLDLRLGRAAERYRRQARIVDDLSAILEELCAPRAAAGTYHFRRRIPAHLPDVFGDPNLLREAIDRLLDNAVKFCLPRRDGPAEIALIASSTGSEVHIAIQDNGVGFPPAVAPQLFDLFYQHDRELMEQQGAGVGLTIVREVVDLHDGRVEVMSKPGEGSTFTVVLPVARPAGRAANGAGRPTHAPTPATVLLVEDEYFLLQGLRDLLETFESRYDLTIFTASDGLEALKRISRDKPDLIVSDIMMPRMDGYELLAEVRRQPDWLDIPFVFLTARGERQDILRGRSSGVEEYITKPYDGADLFNLIIAQLDRRFQRAGVMAHDFEQLKRDILELLLPEFKLPLLTVTDQTQKLADGLQQVKTDEDLHAYLVAIQEGSQVVNRMARDFVFMTEFRAGEAANSFASRARPFPIEPLFLYLRREWPGLQTIITPEAQNVLVLMDRDLLQDALLRLVRSLAAAAPDAPESQAVLRVRHRDGTLGLRLDCRRTALDREGLAEVGRLLAAESPDLAALARYNADFMVIRGVLDLHAARLSLRPVQGAGCAILVTIPVYTTPALP